ncbi:MAG: DUF1361 domain-containing protein [Ferruginibacter sp.]
MKNINSLPAFQKLLVLFIAFIIGMMVCRICYSASLRYIFLLWNLFLGWIPFQISLYLSKNKVAKWKNWLCLFGWLLFFPNALYIITDFVHLGAKTNVPVWYDAVLLFTCAITGLMMAFASLYKVEIFLTKRIGKSIANKLVIIALFLGSFGVYLGRFLRWNSWDIISNPIELFSEIGVRFLSPLEHYRTWAITLLLTALFSLIYFGIKKMPAYTHSVKAQ